MRTNSALKLRWWLVLPLAVLLALTWQTILQSPAPTPTALPLAGASPTRKSPPRASTATATVTRPPTATPSPTLFPVPTDTPPVTVPTTAGMTATVPTATVLSVAVETVVVSTTAVSTAAVAAAGASVQPTSTLVPTSTATTTEEPPALAMGDQPSFHPAVAPAVLANYFPWYDPGTWSTGCTSGGDLPRDGVYQSDDGGAIARHIGQAQAAGLDGFAVHWFVAGDRTDSNFAQVLGQSPDGFDSTVTFLYHILPGVDQQGVVDGLNHITINYGSHPRFFRVAGKPVILFSDMYRVPDATGVRPVSDQDVSTALARWGAIRQAVDPDHNTWWITEGLQPDYLAVFDGLYVYKIDHACCPGAFASASRWAGWTRDWEQQTGQPKLWVGTVMPGWNDLNSAQAHCVDLRVSSEPFARDRASGAYYAQTWEAVLPTRPDFVVLHSFNEWVEGSYVEPSAHFGDLYLQLTAQWVARFKDSR